MPNGQAPYGDIFTIETPNIDRFSRQLWEDQKRREIEQARQARDLQEEFAKNIANIRDADVNDFALAYQDWKTAYNELQRRPPKNDQERIQQQMEVAKKLANAYSVANASKLQKEIEETEYKKHAIPTNQNYYDDNAAEWLQIARRTPINKLKSVEWTNPQTGQKQVMDLSNLSDTLRYKGSTTAFADDLKKAAGNFVLGEGTPKDTEDGLQTIIPQVKQYNTPQQFYNTFIGQIAGSKKANDLVKVYEYTPERAKQIEEQFEILMSNPEIKKMWGITGEPLVANAKTKAERTAELLTKEWALTNFPKETGQKRVINKGAVMDRQESFTREMTNTRHLNALNRLYVYAGIQANKPMTPKQVEDGVTKLITDYIDEANSNPNNEVNMDAGTFKSLTGVDKSKNSYITFDEQGNALYGKKGDDGKPVGTLNRIPYDLAKGKIIKLVPKISQTGGAVPQNKNPKPGGKTISKDQYRKMTISQRSEFINSGGKVQ